MADQEDKAHEEGKEAHENNTRSRETLKTEGWMKLKGDKGLCLHLVYKGEKNKEAKHKKMEIRGNSSCYLMIMRQLR